MQFRVDRLYASALRAARYALLCALVCCAPARAIFAQSIHLRSATFDPLDPASQSDAQRAQLRSLAARTTKLEPGERHLLVLQWSEAYGPAALDALAAEGVQTVAPLADHAWIVTAPPGLDLAQALRPRPGLAGALRWASPLAADWKLSPELIAARADAASSSSATRRFHVQFADTGALKHARERLAARTPHMEFHSRQRASEVWTVESTLPQMLALAEENAVLWIESAPLPQLADERGALFVAGILDERGACVGLPGGGSYAQWLSAAGLSGQGQIVQVMDDGLSQGNASNLPGTAHPDILGRIAGIDNATLEANGESVGGHGHLNASIVMGRPVASGGMLDAGGYLLGQGVAPSASVFATRIFNDEVIFETPNRTLQQLAAPAYAAGARISSNSWTAAVFGLYTADSLEIDRITRDMDSQTSGDQAMLFIFAAGNARSVGSIGSPATAKNVISVGALENCDFGDADKCGSGLLDSDDMRDVAAFQSRGPLADGRLGPTLTAPGVHITGAASDSPRYTGAGVCGRGSVEPGEPADARRYYPAFQNLYTYSSGTSHSTPIVAGAAALAREFFQRTYGMDPSPALLRAALVAGATDPVGGRINDGTPVRLGFIPNNQVGWGRANLARVIEPGSSRAFIDQTQVLTPDQRSYAQSLQITDSTTPLRIVLAWTDAQGALNAEAAIVNDLDLELTDGTHTWRGNVFADGHSAEEGVADRLNTTEVILLNDPQPGLYTVTVRAAILAGDGLPNRPGVLDQDFALFIANGNGQTSRGRLEFDQAAYTCSDRPVVSLSDFDLRGAQSVQVMLHSVATGDSETLTLGEQGSQSGIFRGELPLQAAADFAPEDGTLATADGDTLQADYLDLHPADQAEPTLTSTTATLDCRPPRIIRQQVLELSAESALLEFETDEPARINLRYGADCAALDHLAQSKDLSLTHQIPLDGLEACQLVAYRVELIDAVGNTTQQAVAASECQYLQTLAREVTFEDAFDPAPQPGWLHAAALGADAWQAGLSGFAGNDSVSWHSAAAAQAADSALVTPPVTLGGAERLIFHHAYQFEAIGLSEGFDGAVLEITSDGGETWSDLGAAIVEGGYNTLLSSAFGNPLGGRMAWSGGSIGLLRRVVVDLAAYAGRTVQVRFRLGCDRSIGGPGWQIDDVALAHDVYCLSSLAGVSPFSATFGCAAESIRFLISDSDLAEASGTLPDPGNFSIALAPDFQGIPVQPLDLRRVDPAGVFEASLPVTASPVSAARRVAGVVDVLPGQTLSIFYDDPHTPLGPRRASNGVMLDCTPPLLIATQVAAALPDRVTLRIESDEAVRVELLLGSAPGITERRILTDTLALMPSIEIAGLNACTPYFYQLILTDAVGNQAVFDNEGAGFGFTTTQSAVQFDTLEPQPSPGWNTAAALAGDAWLLQESPWAASPSHVWAASGVNRVKDAWLITPPFAVDADTRLSFLHTFALESGFDGGVIELSTDGGLNWFDLASHITQGGYNTTLAANFGNPLAGRPAWSGGTLGAMQPVSVSLGLFAGEGRRLRFRLGCDRTGGGGAWLIDDLRIEGSPLCGPQFPAVPLLLAPDRDKANVPFAAPAALSWEPSAEAQRYRIYFGRDPAALPLLGEVVAPLSELPMPPLKAGTLYYWRVTALNALGSSASALQSFRTLSIPLTRIVDHLLGKPSALNAAERSAADYDDDGAVRSNDLVTGINRAP